MKFDFFLFKDYPPYNRNHEKWLNLQKDKSQHLSDDTFQVFTLYLLLIDYLSLEEEMRRNQMKYQFCFQASFWVTISVTKFIYYLMLSILSTNYFP